MMRFRARTRKRIPNFGLASADKEVLSYERERVDRVKSTVLVGCSTVRQEPSVFKLKVVYCKKSL